MTTIDIIGVVLSGAIGAFVCGGTVWVLFDARRLRRTRRR
jgi:hypothetical protein